MPLSSYAILLIPQDPILVNGSSVYVQSYNWSLSGHAQFEPEFITNVGRLMCNDHCIYFFGVYENGVLISTVEQGIAGGPSYEIFGIGNSLPNKDDFNKKVPSSGQMLLKTNGIDYKPLQPYYVCLAVWSSIFPLNRNDRTCKRIMMTNQPCKISPSPILDFGSIVASTQTQHYTSFNTSLECEIANAHPEIRMLKSLKLGNLPVSVQVNGNELVSGRAVKLSTTGLSTPLVFEGSMNGALAPGTYSDSTTLILNYP